TPIVLPRAGRPRTITCALLTAAVVQLLFVTLLTQTALLVAAFLLGLAGQIVKLTGDAAMQIEIDDARRGQVFALQDTVFNIAFLAAIAAAAVVVAPDGRSPGLAVLGVGIYLSGLAGVLAVRHLRA
ncbi:MAG: hypothetical protein WAX14_07390, partial [Rhodococcus sp. (in: high G+C Gram-positive bacteria)]